MNAKQILSHVFNQDCISFIEYNTQWENGTGYLDNAVNSWDHSPRLEPGDCVKSQSTKGRRIIIVGTPIGNVVIFERYTDPECAIVVANMPRGISRIVDDCGSLSPETISKVLGVHVYSGEIDFLKSDNIGHKVKNIIDAFNSILGHKEHRYCEIVN